MKSMLRSGWNFIKIPYERTKRIRPVVLKSRVVTGGPRSTGLLLASAKKIRTKRNRRNFQSESKIKRANTTCTKRQKTKNTKQI